MSRLPAELTYLAKIGAAHRLQQLDAERRAITTVFPELVRRGRFVASERTLTVTVAPRKRRKMSAEARAKIGAAATLRWAAWRAAKKAN